METARLHIGLNVNEFIQKFLIAKHVSERQSCLEIGLINVRLISLL